MADTSEPTTSARAVGQSVASYWAELLAACEAGPVEVANRDNEVVAVMVSKADWEGLTKLRGFPW